MTALTSASMATAASVQRAYDRVLTKTDGDDRSVASNKKRSLTPASTQQRRPARRSTT